MTERPQEEERPEPLSRLASTPVPPSQLEERVVTELRRRGVIRRGIGMRRGGGWLRFLLAAAAVLTAFSIGRVTAPASSPPDGPRWLLLLYEDAAFQAPTPAGRAERVDEYRRWGSRVRAVDGAELGVGATLMDRDGVQGTTEPALASIGRVAGYFVITAATLEEARAIAASCPHLKWGGRLMLRPMT